MERLLAERREPEIHKIFTTIRDRITQLSSGTAPRTFPVRVLHGDWESLTRVLILCIPRRNLRLEEAWLNCPPFSGHSLLLRPRYHSTRSMGTSWVRHELVASPLLVEQDIIILVLQPILLVKAVAGSMGHAWSGHIRTLPMYIARGS